MNRRLVLSSAAGVAVLAMLLAMALWLFGVDEPFTPEIVLYPTTYLSFAVVGAAILARRPGNIIGGLCLAIGLVGSLVAVIDSYARLTAQPPGQDWAAWITAWAFPSTLGPILLVLLLFPNGAPQSARWRPVVWLVVVGSLVVVAGAALTPTLADFPNVDNPVGQGWVNDTPLAGGGVGWFALIIGALAAAVGLGVRLRRSAGIERQQLKVVAFAAALNGISWVALALDLPGAAGELAVYAVFATFAAVPIAIGVAMLRYRLYDFDLIVRRTLVYGALTVLLGGVYVGLVLGLPLVLDPFTPDDSLAVAISTLGVAALFGPARSRVQAAVDRRFYRARYDARRTLEQFAGQVRDQVDIDLLVGELNRVARDTVHPKSLSIWLRQQP
ncbi:MAG TPA: hypothetical protein VHK28_03820 [Candidatus Limnocylindria bacterium]|nr:hypothetical protein [Candidatus Limnocylindria bacterium]